MRLFHITQCTIQNRNVHISVLNGALWDMEPVHCGICGIFLLDINISNQFKVHLTKKNPQDNVR